MKYKLIIDKNAEEEIIAVVHAPSDLTQQIENLVRGFSGADSILGHRDGQPRKLTFEQIECVTVLDRKVIAIDTEGNRFTLKDRLRDLAAVLPAYFIRITKSTLANEHRIARFETVFSGSVDAIFQCGWRDYVSRRCFAEIRRRYEGL